jgi:hypothetical protein
MYWIAYYYFLNSIDYDIGKVENRLHPTGCFLPLSYCAVDWPCHISDRG